MKPGPRPKTNAPKSIHIHFTDEERSTLTAMGTGDVKAKIHALIQLEINRQHPRTKSEALAKWILMRKETLEKAKITAQARIYVIEMGYTEAEVRQFEFAEDEQDEKEI